MREFEYNYIWDNNLHNSITKLSKECSIIKTEIFRGVVMDREMNQNTIKLFKVQVDEFLKYWSDHADNLKSAIRSITDILDEENLKTIDHDYVKPYIYGNFDYPSILQFTAGVLEGINDGTFDDPDKITEFKDHTIGLAFNNQDPDLTELINSVLLSEIGPTYSKTVGTLERQLFMNLRNYNNLFVYRSRNELYRAIEKVLDYIYTDKIMESTVDHKTIKLFISFVNNVVEYITYSLASYACRIYIISTYAQPFIRISQSRSVAERNKVDLLHESGDFRTIDVSENPMGLTSSIFQNTDELIIKDPKKAKEFFQRFEEMIRLIGADNLFEDKKIPTYRRHYCSDKLSKLSGLLDSNALYCYLKERNTYGLTSEVNIIDLHTNLKGFMYNHLQGLEGPTSEKQALLHIIRHIDYGDSLQEKKLLAKDMYVSSLDLNYRLIEWMTMLNEKIDGEIKSKSLSIGALKLMMELAKFMIDLYEEVMFVIAQKMCYIERVINDLTGSEIKKIENLVAIDIKGMKSDASPNDYMSNSISNVMRIPLDKMDSYTEALIDYYEMYDEYLRSQPEFADDWYLSEAIGVSVSGKTNRISAIIDGLFNSFMRFFNGAAFMAARKWVENNKSKLDRLNYGDENSTADKWFPYKKDFAPPENTFNNLKTGLDNFNPEIHMKDIEGFIKTLYPSEEIYQRFQNDSNKAKLWYRNSILYDATDLEKRGLNTETDIKPMVIKGGANIKEYITRAIKTIEDSAGVVPAYKKQHDDLKASIQSFNQKLINIDKTIPKTEGVEFFDEDAKSDYQAKNSANRAKAQGKTQEELKNINISKGNDTTTSSTTSPINNKTAATTGAQELVTRVNQVIIDIWVPIGTNIMEATRNQYTIIKEAFDLFKQEQR